MKDWGVHWFRRDLRIQGNPALLWNCEKHQGRVLGVFVFDPIFLSRPDFSANRFAFFLKTLECLRLELRKRGGDLITLDGGPDHAFRELLKHLKAHDKPLPTAWSWNRDYEPFAVARDTRIQTMLETEFKISTHSERDHLVIEPSELYKADERGTYYQVFTPFSKKWLKMMEEPEFAARVKKTTREPDALHFKSSAILTHPKFTTHALDDYVKKHGMPEMEHPLPQAGEHAAREALATFKKKLDHYGNDRDIPSVAGTSHLSIYFKNGSITVAQVIDALKLKAPSKFLTELIWREFYFHILNHVPRAEQTAFHIKYERLEWENNPKHLKAWKEGKTGFPIVDAGMRQLKKTGWMHNRVRMIVASFLTKDLHCDWKHGERHFMNLLLDGDLAPNNGGWQWAASTGCDPQPYFRIFNPLLQSKRFDPQGDYIRKWVPELRSLDNQDIHAPWAKGDPGVDYPEPIVDHSTQARKIVALYKSVR